MKTLSLRTPVLALSLLASVAMLSACDRAGDTGQQSGTSGTGSQTERGSGTSGTSGSGGTNGANGSSGRSGSSDSATGSAGTSGTGTSGMGNSTREAGGNAREGMGNAADAVANKSKDMAITAAVNARLAGDQRLSALSINVDTVGGRVVLRGTAPDTAARARATELVRSVDGVSEVNNELSVQPSR